jgi:hypothetical protein
MAGPTEDVHFGPPFDFPDGDVYLRSADGTLFRVHKAVLSVTSVTFCEMFASGSADEHRDSLPIVPLLAAEEGKAEVAAFLRIVYTVASSTPGTLDLIRRVLEMGRKYQVNGVRSHCDLLLVSHPALKGSPLTCYALACTFRLERTARISAAECVTQNVDLLLHLPYQLQQLRSLSGEDIFRLYEYRKRCTDAVTAFTQSIGRSETILKSTFGSAIFVRKHEGDMGYGRGSTSYSECPLDMHYHLQNKDLLRPRQWWADYLRACITMLRACPDPTSVMDIRLTGPALVAAKQCSMCSRHAETDLKQFVDWLIDRLVSKLHEVCPCNRRALRAMELI